METGKPVLERMLLLAVLAVSGVAFANEPPDPSPPTHIPLDRLAEQLETRGRQDRAQAERLARGAGLPVRRELPNGRVIEIRRFALGRPPLYLITNNVGAADTISTDELWPGGATGIDINGTGMTVGEWDGGAVYAAHSDLTGRVTQVDGATEISNHATHVAGTLIASGAGLIPDARGMAYGAYLDAYDWNLDDAEMATAGAAGLLVSNHSYGVAAGWLYIGDPAPNTWWWLLVLLFISLFLSLFLSFLSLSLLRYLFSSSSLSFLSFSSFLSSSSISIFLPFLLYPCFFFC